MRHKGIKKEETKGKIIEAISRGFRKYGYSGIGVDGLAKTAGVTSGAFYSHMNSKDAAFEIALEMGLNEVINAIPDFQEKYKNQWIQEFCEYYLSQEHRNDLECGCAMASLTQDVIRSNKNIHQLYEDKMEKIAALIALGLTGDNEEKRIEKAWAMLSILIGGLNIARATHSPALAENISKTIIKAAIDIA